MTLEEARAELGVSSRANERVVQRAFKRLALRYHPNHNAGSAEATARFVRICLAYDILRGARRANPSPAQAAPQRRPWQRARAEEAPAPPQPTYADGEPVHYPTPEEIAALSRPQVASSGARIPYLLLITVGAIVGTLWLIEILADRTPVSMDPARENFLKNMSDRYH